MVAHSSLFSTNNIFEEASSCKDSINSSTRPEKLSLKTNEKKIPSLEPRIIEEYHEADEINT